MGVSKLPAQLWELSLSCHEPPANGACMVCETPEHPYLLN